MTREEAIEFIAQSVKSDVDMAKVADAIEAIEALEQEPVLDKIRAEIEQEPNVSKMAVLDIIDEYRAGSEG